MLDFSSLNNALGSLDESLQVIRKFVTQGGAPSSPEYRTFRAGVIQNFEFTYELSWKAMRTWLAENQGRTLVDGVSRKELFRIAAQNLLIDDIEAWFNYHKKRNLTSHIYEESTADEVFAITEPFLNHAKALYLSLEARND